MSIRSILSILVLLAALPTAALAGALHSNNTQLTPEKACNPHPAPDDIVLPMPCGLQMVFRAVAIPAKGFLWDRKIALGCDDCDRSGMDYYEHRFGSSISGPFSKSDVPSSWQPALEAASDTRSNYYFIGKYEVTNLQWQALMADSCPAGGIGQADTQPKADITWFDAVAFSRRYTEWLLANAPDALPHYPNDSKNVGYLRLPTEAEWEFAARGGSRVPAETLLQEDFFPLAPGTTLADYAAYRSDGDGRILEHPQAIGQLRPNPLGLYDTAGNVAEMALETFHFSLGGQLHGSAGGFLRKGGSFANGGAEIKPGRREEEPFFTTQGGMKARDMGLRLVISGIDTPDGGRRQELLTEWQQLGQEGSVVITGKNPLKEIEKYLAATKDQTLRENLGKLRDIIKDNQVKLEKKDGESVEGLIRTAAYTIEALRSYAVRNSMAIKNKNDALELMNQLKKEGKQNGAMYNFQKETAQKFDELRQGFHDAIFSIISFYKLKLDEISKYKKDMYNSQFASVSGEYKNGSTRFSKNMSKNMDLLGKHMHLLRSEGQAGLTKNKILNDALNKSLRADIQLK